MSAKFNSTFIKSAFKLIFLSILVYFAATFILVLFFKYFNPNITSFVNERASFEYLGILKTTAIQKKWIDIKKMSPHLPLAVVASEDQKFFDHFGFDIEQIEKAIDERERGKRIRGASTITQQLSKNIFLTSEKSLVRKGFESYYTLLIELLWSKKRILEVYLNSAEFGQNIFGVEAASFHYFNKSASGLSKSEAALLIACLPNPIRYRVKNPSTFMINRQNRIMRQMDLIGGKSMIKKELEIN